MPTFTIPIPTTATPDVDSLDARQARNNAQTETGAVAFLTAFRTELGARYSHTWGTPKPQRDAAGKPVLNANKKPVPDPSNRANENNLSPAEVLAGYGTNAQGYFEDFAALVPVAIQLGVLNPDGTHPITGDDLTCCPAGYAVAFAADGTGTVTYTEHDDGTITLDAPSAPVPAA